MNDHSQLQLNPLPSQVVLDAYFLEARCKALDLAAILDRIDRGQTKMTDPRLAKLKSAIQALLADQTGRAEKIQQIFSLPYESNWPIPQPK